MPYICIYIYIINTRPCPNEKTNLLNISFINVPTIAFFLIFSGATQKGRCSFEWRRCQRNGAYQSIKSVGTRERRKNILQLLSIIEEIAVPCIGLRKQSEERFTPVRYHCKATVIYNIRAFTVDFRVIAALKLCEITYKTALDLPTDIARRCKSEVRLGTLKQCDYPARNIRH